MIKLKKYSKIILFIIYFLLNCDSAFSAITLVSSQNYLEFTGVNFGVVSGQQQTVSFSVPSTAVIDGVDVLTQGVTGLDFTNVSSGTTCLPMVTNMACDVVIKFLPIAPGMRIGALVVRYTENSTAKTITVPMFGMSNSAIGAFSTGTGSKINITGLSPNLPFQLAVDGSGTMYIGEYWGQKVYSVPAGGGPATVLIDHNTVVNGVAVTDICGVAVDGAGNLYVADYYHSRVIVRSKAGVFSELAFSNLSNTSSGKVLNQPTGLHLDKQGNLYIADYVNARIVVAAYSEPGTVTSGRVIPLGTFSPNVASITGVAVDNNNNVYIADRIANRIIKVPYAGGANFDPISATYGTATLFQTGTLLSMPQGVATDGFNNVYIADAGHSRIVQVTSTGEAMPISVQGLSSPTSLSGMFGVTVDGSGNILIPDWTNSRLVRIDRSSTSVNFNNANVGATSSSQSIKLSSLGSIDLNIPSLSSASNPTVSGDFTLDNSSTTCPNLASGAPAAVLALGTSCTLSVTFSPITSGARSGALALTHNSQNTTAPTYTTQSIQLNGTGVALPTPTLTFSTPSRATVLMLGTLTNSATSSLPGGSYGAISYTSSNTAVATVSSSGVITPMSAGSATITATQAAVSGVNAQATQSYTLTVLGVQIIGGSSYGTASITGGGFVAGTSRFTAGTNPPAGKTFPYGVFDFTAQTSSGGTVTITITYPQALPPNTMYLKLINGSWVDWTNQITVSGNSVTYSVVDNGIGDSDSTLEIITDPFGPVVDSEVALSKIPTLSEWTMIFLASLMAMLAIRRMRPH